MYNQTSAALDSVTEAAAAGKLYAPSRATMSSNHDEDDTEGFMGDSCDVYSDDEGAAEGFWSGAGTGTEGEVKIVILQGVTSVVVRRGRLLVRVFADFLLSESCVMYIFRRGDSTDYSSPLQGDAARQKIIFVTLCFP